MTQIPQLTTNTRKKLKRKNKISGRNDFDNLSWTFENWVDTGTEWFSKWRTNRALCRFGAMLGKI